MALTLSQKIIAIYPDLAASKSAWEGIELKNDGSGDKIKTWSHSSHAQPTDSQLAAATEDQLKVALYKSKRKSAYGEIGDQLDLLYKDIVAGKVDATGEWAKAIKKVKDDYPKS